MSEMQLFRLGADVRCADGECGKLKSLVVRPGDDMVTHLAVDPATGRVTFVLLRTGRLWSHRAVLVPRSAVAEVGADGFHLDITVQQVRDLPPADTDHPAS
jgi:hypothetical protein